MQPNNDVLASRVREIRMEEFGADGANLAHALEIPVRTWNHYESGVTIPACVLLEFIELTGVEPRWLLTGQGDPYRARSIKPGSRASR